MSSDLEAMVYILSHLSEEFLTHAHRLSHLARSPGPNRDTYYAFIYSSIKTLTSALSLQNLPPATEVSVLLRLAQIYMEETENFECCERYISKALSLAERTGDQLYLHAEVFAAIIVSRGSSRVALRYLTAKTKSLASLGRLLSSQVLQLFRQAVLMAADPKAGLIALREFNSRQDLPIEIWQLLALREVSYALFRGNPKLAGSILEEFARKEKSGVPQIQAMELLNSILWLFHASDLDSCRKKISLLNSLLAEQVKGNKKKWSSDGSFALNIADAKIEGFQLKVNWLSLEEVQCVLWLYSGLCTMHKYHDSSKAQYYLSTALSLVQKHEDSVVQKGVVKGSRILLSDLNIKLMRLKFIRLQINFYLCFWHHLSSRDDIKETKKSLFSLQNTLQSLSPTEQACFKKPFVKNAYLLGLLSQNSNNFKAAAFYYTKVRELCSRPESFGLSRDLEFAYFCALIGLGSQTPYEGHSELYLFSTLNLILVLNAMAKTATPDEMVSLTSERNFLLEELSLMMKIDENLSKVLLFETKTLFDVIFDSSSYQNLQKLLSKLLEEPRKSHGFSPDLYVLSAFVLSKATPDSTEKRRLLQDCFTLSLKTQSFAIRNLAAKELGTELHS